MYQTHLVARVRSFKDEVLEYAKKRIAMLLVLSLPYLLYYAAAGSTVPSTHEGGYFSMLAGEFLLPSDIALHSKLAE